MRTNQRILSNCDPQTLEAALASLEANYPQLDYKMPSFFVGHGSPLNAIEDNSFTRGWKAAFSDVPEPKAILCISAHWLTKGTLVTSMQTPRTIHDFQGFPQNLHQVQYPARGEPFLAGWIANNTLSNAIELDEAWGLDHGTWSVLRPVFPDASIPVLQMSIDWGKRSEWHYELAKKLSHLRRRGVLILGSGNIVHNLGRLDFSRPDAGYDWAVELDRLVQRSIRQRDHAALIDYTKFGPAARLAIPTPDHYYPLLYAMAMQEPTDEVTIFNDSAVMGSITMTSVKISPAGS